MNDLRLELRSRNNILWHAIFDTAESVAEFCRLHDITNQSLVGAILNLTVSPYGRMGLRPFADRLCRATGLGADELFPPALYSGVIPSMRVAEVESSRFLSLDAAKRLSLPASQDDNLFDQDRRALLDAALASLTPREAMVVRARYGIGSDEESSLGDVARELGVSKSRVAQIEAKALRKLRHPSRSRPLRPALFSEGVENEMDDADAERG